LISTEGDSSDPTTWQDPGLLAPGLQVPRRVVLRAYAGFVMTDVMMKLGGYPLLRRWLERRPRWPRPRRRRSLSSEQAVAAVDLAAVWYVHQLRCLQRSVVIAWLLRRRGVGAQLVIGCRHTPFYAHAWVELDGVVVNDQKSVRRRYQKMERV
jgi:hypothetical protein